MIPLPITPAPNTGAPFVVYGLVDPRSGEIRYVGRTSRRLQRLGQHLQTTDGPRGEWLVELAASGWTPIMVTIEECQMPAESVSRERHWIDYGHAHGWPLLNRRAGPIPRRDARREIVPVRFSTEERAAIRAALLPGETENEFIREASMKEVRRRKKRREGQPA